MSGISRLYVAGRGAAAEAVAGAARRLGMVPVAAQAGDDVADPAAVVATALSRGCDAVHPDEGRGPLERELAAAVRAAGLVHVGPRTQVLESVGDPERLARLAAGAGLTFGGVPAAGSRRITVVVAGDGQRVEHLHDRDDTLGWPGDPLVAFVPAPGLGEVTRVRVHDVAVRLAEDLELESVGAVELRVAGAEIALLGLRSGLVRSDAANAAACGLDLYELQLRLAGGESLAGLGLYASPVLRSMAAVASLGGSDDDGDAPVVTAPSLDQVRAEMAGVLAARIVTQPNGRARLAAEVLGDEVVVAGRHDEAWAEAFLVGTDPGDRQRSPVVPAQSVGEPVQLPAQDVALLLAVLDRLHEPTDMVALGRALAAAGPLRDRVRAALDSAGIDLAGVDPGLDI